MCSLRPLHLFQSHEQKLFVLYLPLIVFCSRLLDNPIAAFILRVFQYLVKAPQLRFSLRKMRTAIDAQKNSAKSKFDLKFFNPSKSFWLQMNLAFWKRSFKFVLSMFFFKTEKNYFLLICFAFASTSLASYKRPSSQKIQIGKIFGRVCCL